MTYYETLVEKMLNYYCGMTRQTPDQASDVAIRIKVLAAQLDTLCQQAEEVGRQAFAGTAAGEALDRHAALRGLTRKPGAKASCAVMFSRPAAAGYSILIPAGTIVQTGGPEALRYATRWDMTMGPTAASIICTVDAMEPGARYNVRGRQISVMVTPPAGITQVMQYSDCSGGADPEGDEELRARLMDSCRFPGVGGSVGYYRSLMLAQAAVRKVKVLPTHRGSGTVDLVVYGADGPLSQYQMEEIQELLAKERDLGVDVQARCAQTTPLNLQLELAVGEGWDFPAVSAACQEALRAAMAELEIGEPWLLARMGKTVMSQPGVYNCRIVLPAADAFPLDDRLLVPGGITINPMEVAV